MGEREIDEATWGEHTHVVRAGKTELSLEQLVALQPGVAGLMIEVGERFGRCYHAAKAGNRRLARFQLSEGTKLLRQCAVVRPKYGEDVDRFIAENLARLREVVEGGDPGAVEAAFAAITAEVNRLHEVWDHGFLVWRPPAEPPADLVLEPRPGD